MSTRKMSGINLLIKTSFKNKKLKIIFFVYSLLSGEPLPLARVSDPLHGVPHPLPGLPG
jgi:hypothetical protein